VSGYNVPYQLRPNKFVERQLFLDILDFVRVWNGPWRYIYASMGGRFLEDFKLVNSRFAIEQMISIELDNTTSTRQGFNRLGFIECRNQSSGEFIEELDGLIASHANRRLVVWLDFAVANKRGEQLGEFRHLVSKLTSGDVAKITLNANSQSFRRRANALTRKDFDQYLKDPDSAIYKDYDTYVANVMAFSSEGAHASTDRFLAMSDSDHETICVENLKEQLGDYLPSGGIAAEHLRTEAFAEFLSQAVKIAALKGVESTKLHVVPLGIFRYRDGEHQMLTVTTILANDALMQSIQGDEVFREWPFRPPTWNSVVEVDVPDMSTKERHYIEGLISSQHNPQGIHGEMPFRFDRQDAVSLSLLEQYLRHYRRYPSFVRTS